jgi:hypothetical protein
MMAIHAEVRRIRLVAEDLATMVERTPDDGRKVDAMALAREVLDALRELERYTAKVDRG